MGGATSIVTSIFELSNGRPARSHVYPVQGRVALQDKLICLRRIFVLLDSESDGLNPRARLGLFPSRCRKCFGLILSFLSKTVHQVTSCLRAPLKRNGRMAERLPFEIVSANFGFRFDFAASD